MMNTPTIRAWPVCWRAASTLARPGAAGLRPLIRGGTIYDGSGGAPYRRRCRDQRRQDRLCRTACAGPGGAGHRREGQGGLAGLHQHAELGDRKPDRRRPRHERHRPGRHARSDGRRRLHGPVERRDEAARAQAAGRHQISDPLDDARPVSRISDQRKGVTPNVASFVGATTVRVHELGEKDVDPTPEQLDAHARARPRRR